MIRRVMICLTLLAIILAVVGCSSSGTSVTASIDTTHIRLSNLSDALLIPVIVTPTAVPKSDVSYTVHLSSKDGYSYYSDFPSVLWVTGQAATAKTVYFYIPSNDQSASNVYDQLYSDYKNHNLDMLSEDVSTLLRLQISKE